MTDALSRIGERVLATCRTLTTAPPEVRFPGALLDVTADPALLAASVWSGVLTAPAPRAPQHADPFAQPEYDDEAFAQRTFGEPFDPLASDAARHGAAAAASARANNAAVQPPASPARGDAWWNDRAGVQGMPVTARPRVAAPSFAGDVRTAREVAAAPAPGRSPLAGSAAAPSPPPAALRRAASTRVAASSPARAAAPERRPAVSLVRPLRPGALPAPGTPPASGAPPVPGALPAAAAPPRSHVAPHARSASDEPLMRPPAAAPALRPLAEADVPRAAAAARPPSAPAPTRMVRGAAGLASVLGAHLGTAPAPATPLAAQPAPALAPDLLQLAPHAAPAADAFDADALYDALESRLRAEFLRTYGSYGS